MNLVDAIRRAANEAGADRTTVVGLFAVPTGLGPEVPLQDPAPATPAVSTSPDGSAETVTPSRESRTESEPVVGESVVEVPVASTPVTSVPVVDPRTSDALATEPDGVSGPGATGNLVRIELFLGPEQLHAMLRGAFSGHRSVMTLRETAHYLRLTTSALERLVQEGSFPAFRVEGHWRFLKSAVDDWAATRTLSAPDSKDSRDAA